MSDTPVGPSSDADLRDLVMDHEDAAARAAVAPWDQWLAGARTDLLRQWDSMWGTDEPTADQLEEWWPTVQFTRTPEGSAITTAISAEAGEAAATVGAMMIPELPRTSAEIDRARTVASRHERARDALRGVLFLNADLEVTLASPPDGLTVDDAMGHVTRAAHTARNRAQSAARFTVNAVANQARIVMAQQLEETVGAPLVLVWAPETDACVHCLAYAGQYVPADGSGTFPEGLSYDPKGGVTPFGDLVAPPLHPHCRCDLEPWSLDWGTDLPDALVREAERSVLRGWAMESESNAARLRAAEDLLEEGTEQLDVATVTREARRRAQRTPDQFRRDAPG